MSSSHSNNRGGGNKRKDTILVEKVRESLSLPNSVQCVDDFIWMHTNLVLLLGSLSISCSVFPESPNRFLESPSNLPHKKSIRDLDWYIVPSLLVAVTCLYFRNGF